VTERERRKKTRKREGDLLGLLKGIAGGFLRRISGYRPVRKIVSFLTEVDRGELPASVRPDLGAFTDAKGNRITLWSGLRDWLKPEWRSMFEAPADDAPMVTDTAALASRRSVEEAIRFLRLAGVEVEGKRIAEIGCYDGTRSFTLAGLGAGEVIATDIPEYYLNQQEDTTLSAEEVERGREIQRRRFEAGAGKCEQLFGWSGLRDRVSYAEDDICATELPGETFDLVVSWEVLEHVEQPTDLFRSLARILKPGGISFHEYNPFFAINGGHSLCTLDFLWGHARLSNEDFSRYLREFRPGEEDVAGRFFTRNLNRMSHDDLRRGAKDAGLELLAFLPWFDRFDERLLDREILESVQALYPAVTAEDLLARDVRVLVGKPDRT